MGKGLGTERDACASISQEEVLVGAEEVGVRPAFAGSVVPGRGRAGRRPSGLSEGLPVFPQQAISSRL